MREAGVLGVPMYYFEFQTATGPERIDGIDLPEADLQNEAIRGAKDIMCEGIINGLDRTGWTLRVYDETGQVALAFKFADLLRKE